ncbi:hypothetical protein ACH5RR_002772 [Cinchona calisaya]|uniref:Uncharacterized protein n=1 Tax=Cinchona calisaya TaxID=153742 RepID=A0ABD3ASZ5_9GENT
MQVQVWNLPSHWGSKEAGFKTGEVFHKIRDVKIFLRGAKKELCYLSSKISDFKEDQYAHWLRGAYGKSPSSRKTPHKEEDLVEKVRIEVKPTKEGWTRLDSSGNNRSDTKAVTECGM